MKIITTVLILLIVTFVLAFEQDRFVWIGPYGGFDQEIIATKDFLFLLGQEGSSTRLYRSGNNGLSWQPLSFQAKLIRIHPQNSNRLLAYGSALYISDNAGRNWQKVSESLNPRLVADLQFHPTNSNILYASINGYLNRSLDAGKTWLRVSNFNVYAFLVHPTNGEVIYFDSDGSFYKSSDGGHTSQLLAKVARPFTNLIMDPSNPQTFYARSSHHILQSIDGGLRWSAKPCDCEHSQVVLDQNNPKILYAFGRDLKRSTDAANTGA